MAENSDEEEKEEVLKGERVKNMDKTPEEDYACSEGSASEEDDDDVPRELLISIQCEYGFCEGNNGDRKFVGGQYLAPEGAKNFQPRTIEPGDDGGYKEVSCSDRSPEPGSKSIMMIKEDRTEDAVEEPEEENQKELFDFQTEGMQIKQEEDQDLIAAVDWENVETIKDFSGEEHQEGGESFTEYYLDCSSCEYIKDEEIYQESNHQFSVRQDTCLEKSVSGMTELGKIEDSYEEGDNCLYSGNLEEDIEKIGSQDVISAEKGKIELVKLMCNRSKIRCDDGGEPGERDSSSSRDDETSGKRSGQVLSEKMCRNSLRFAMWGKSNDYTEAGQTDFNTKQKLESLTSDNPSSEGLFTTEDTDKWEKLVSDVTHHPEENGNTNSVVQRDDKRTTSPSNQGCLDESFFFNTELETSGTSELGLLRDDDFEDKRNWEEEQERIKAFNRFYNQGNREIRREGRQMKVQFCKNPLSSVIRYEINSSDRDSSSSSTDGEEDTSYAEAMEDLVLPMELREPEDIKSAQIPDNVPNLNRPNYT